MRFINLHILDFPFLLFPINCMKCTVAPHQGSSAGKELEVALQLAEEDVIYGLPAPPQKFGGLDPGTDFQLRRIECTCHYHAKERAILSERLRVLKSRPSADPEDTQVQELEMHLEALGEYPQRAPRSEEELKAARKRCRERANVENVGKQYRTPMAVNCSRLASCKSALSCWN